MHSWKRYSGLSVSIIDTVLCRTLVINFETKFNIGHSKKGFIIFEQAKLDDPMFDKQSYYAVLKNIDYSVYTPYLARLYIRDMNTANLQRPLILHALFG